MGKQCRSSSVRIRIRRGEKRERKKFLFGIEDRKSRKQSCSTPEGRRSCNYIPVKLRASNERSGSLSRKEKHQIVGQGRKQLPHCEELYSTYLYDVGYIFVSHSPHHVIKETPHASNCGIADRSSTDVNGVVPYVPCSALSPSSLRLNMT